MAFTTAEKLKVKKHLGFNPTYQDLDPLLLALEDGGQMETDAKAAIALCDTTLAAYQLGQTEADDLESGEGAVFNPNRRISIKRRAYREACADLARMLGLDISAGSRIAQV